MKDKANRQQETKSEPKRAFVKPELRREGELPKITNTIAGTFQGGPQTQP